MQDPKTTFVTTTATVKKVDSTSDGSYSFIANLVDRQGKEVIVSDPLASTFYKVGDPINDIDRKIAVDSSTETLSFSIIN